MIEKLKRFLNAERRLIAEVAFEKPLFAVLPGRKKSSMPPVYYPRPC